MRPLVSSDLTRFDLGRTQRLPSLDLRELLAAVDGHRCRSPGCTRRRKLHAHATTDGAPVPHHPDLPWRPAEELDTAGHIEATTLPPTVIGQRLDLSYAVAVVLRQAA